MTAQAGIYLLIDPRDSTPFYIGKGSNAALRARKHSCLSVMRKDNPDTRERVAAILASGLDVLIEILEVVDDARSPSVPVRSHWSLCRNLSRLNDAEIYWIAFFRALGWELTNKAIGGNGGRRVDMEGDRNPMRRPEVVGKFVGEGNPMARQDVLEKFFIGDANHFFGRRHTEETKQRQRAVKLGKYAGEKNPMFGRSGPLAPFYGVKGADHPAFGRRGELHACFGKVCSPETRAKISAAQKARFAAKRNAGT